jgi:hypothetical protein
MFSCATIIYISNQPFLGVQVANTITDTKPATPGWTYVQTHHDNFDLRGPEREMRKFRGPSYVKSLDGTPPFSFRTYLQLCWFCGSNGINPAQT